MSDANLVSCKKNNLPVPFVFFNRFAQAKLMLNDAENALRIANQALNHDPDFPEMIEFKKKVLVNYYTLVVVFSLLLFSYCAELYYIGSLLVKFTAI